MATGDSLSRSLTWREESIVHYVNTHSNREIGDLLGITERTVKYHVDRIRLKAGAGTRRELIRILQEEGII